MEEVFGVWGVSGLGRNAVRLGHLIENPFERSLPKHRAYYYCVINCEANKLPLCKRGKSEAKGDFKG